jgi:hypothetical protein
LNPSLEKTMQLDPQTKPTTAAAVVLEILRNSAEPLTRHGIFNICKGRGMYQDFSDIKGSNAISSILKPLEASGQVAKFGITDVNAVLWGIPGIHPTEGAESNGPSPIEAIKESQLTVDSASEIPGTIERTALSTLTTRFLELPELLDTDEGIRPIIVFETPDGQRHRDLASARDALAEIRFCHEVDKFLAATQIAVGESVSKAIIRAWETWKAV